MVNVKTAAEKTLLNTSIPSLQVDKVLDHTHSTVMEEIVHTPIKKKALSKDENPQLFKFKQAEVKVFFYCLQFIYILVF